MFPKILTQILCAVCRRRRRGTWSKFHFEYSRRYFRFWWRASVGFIFIGIRCTHTHTALQSHAHAYECANISWDERTAHAWSWHALLQEKLNRLCFASESIVIVHRNTLSGLEALRLGISTASPGITDVCCILILHKPKRFQIHNSTTCNEFFSSFRIICIEVHY